MKVRRFQGAGVSALGGLACLAAGVNVFLVVLYYFVGMGRQEKILNRQISFAADLQRPVPVHIAVIQEGRAAGASFQASKWWFTDRGVPVTKLEQAPPRPRMKIHKTESRVPLPPDWKLSLKDPKDEELFRKRGLIED